VQGSFTPLRLAINLKRKKMNKKFYFEPECEAVALDMMSAILVGSGEMEGDPVPSGGGEGEEIPGGWG
jgi:hypothetical protein